MEEVGEFSRKIKRSRVWALIQLAAAERDRASQEQKAEGARTCVEDEFWGGQGQ